MDRENGEEVGEDRDRHARAGEAGVSDHVDALPQEGPEARQAAYNCRLVSLRI
jgi:hypothetical protein